MALLVLHVSYDPFSGIPDCHSGLTGQTTLLALIAPVLKSVSFAQMALKGWILKGLVLKGLTVEDCR